MLIMPHRPRFADESVQTRALEHYQTFMCALSELPAARAIEIRVRQAIPDAAAILGISVDDLALSLVECGLRGPRFIFPQNVVSTWADNPDSFGPDVIDVVSRWARRYGASAPAPSRRSSDADELPLSVRPLGQRGLPSQSVNLQNAMHSQSLAPSFHGADTPFMTNGRGRFNPMQVTFSTAAD